MKPLAILILAALPLLTGCYTTPGYYGAGYGYVSGSPYYYGGSYGYVSGSPYYYGRKHGYVSRPPYLGFGYPYAFKHHYRHRGVRSHKHSIRKGHSPYHRFHRPNFKSRPHFNRATREYRGSQKHRFKQRSLRRYHYRGTGQGFKRGHNGTGQGFRRGHNGTGQGFRRGHNGTRQGFRGHRRGTGRSFGRGTSFGRGFRR